MRVYDPRDDTWKESDNPALIWAWLITQGSRSVGVDPKTGRRIPLADDFGVVGQFGPKVVT